MASALRRAVRDTFVLLGVIAAVVLLAAAAVPPERLGASVLRWVPPCPERLAGRRCVFCGMTHSFGAMARGRLSEAAGHNPLGPAVFAATAAVAAGGLAVGGAQFSRRRRPRITRGM